MTYNKYILYKLSLVMGLIFCPVFLELIYAEGGMSGAGGGNGVACFQNELEAKNAFQANGELLSNSFTKMISFETLDVWEMPTNVDFFMPKKDEEVMPFLKRILQEHWQMFSPDFVSQVLFALDKFGQALLNGENSFKNLPVLVIQDTGQIEKPLPSNCQMVGVINRFELKRTGEFPELNVRFNYEALKHLGGADATIRVLNQAAMILHETLYILAGARGDTNSHDARLTTRLLLSKTDFDQINNFAGNDSLMVAQNWINIGLNSSSNPEAQKSFAFFHLLNKLHLDQFIGLFEKNGEAGVHSYQFTKKSRAQSWISIQKKAKLCDEEWNQKHNPEQQALNSLGLIFQAYYKYHLCPEFELTDEEAFLFMSVIAYERGQILSPYVFINTHTDDRKGFQQVCNNLSDIPTQDLDSRSLRFITKARNHCRQVSILD